MLFAAEETAEHAVEAAGWFLENSWLIPLIPGIAFFKEISFIFGFHPGQGLDV